MGSPQQPRSRGFPRLGPAGWRGFAVLLAALGGCATPKAPPPKAAAQSAPQVDPSNPTFSDRVAAAQSVLETKGESTTDAKIDATQTITREIAAEDRLQHLARVKPLARALADLQKGRGFWEYTAATTTTGGGATHVRVEHFDPSQPDETLWTLVSLDGKGPAPAEQASYRRLRCATWKRIQAERPRRAESDDISRRAVFDFFTITPQPPGSTVEYAFVAAPTKIGPLFSVAQFRDAFLLDAGSHRLLRRESELLYRVGVTGGIGVDAFHVSAEFGEFGVGRFPFVSRTTTSIRLHAHGKDLGETTVVVEYSGYHPVEGNGRRRIEPVGLPQLIDSVPGAL